MKLNKKINFNNNFVSKIIKKLNRGQKMEPFEVRNAVKVVLKKEVSCPQIFLGSLFSSLMYIREIGILKNAIHGALDLDGILNKKNNFIKNLYSIGGSGKDDIKTFNISSTVSIVAAAMGMKMLKIGAPGTSNKIGSKDLLDMFRIFKHKELKTVCQQRKDENFIYMSVDNIVPHLFSFYDGTFFYPNVLSYGLLPIITPFKLAGMIYGLSDPRVEISAGILKNFGMRNVLVVAGMDRTGDNFFDEISVIGNTKIVRIDKGGNIKKYTLTPKIFGFSYRNFEKIKESDNLKSARSKVINILKGTASPIELDSVAVNAGGLLFLSGRALSIKKGYQEAIIFLKSGKSFDYFKKLIK